MNTVTYIGDCSILDGDSISEMVEDSKDITAKSFKKAIGTEQYNKLSQDLGYEPRAKLRLDTDCHVSFSRSAYQGKKCVYCTWSAFEHVFLLE
ncbi:hypothetical protein [Chroococcidiopsis sp.]|uniref:hypothetical protein n=1 Tax=Chroococcidiopsis sp. TaxID=3088168 RepID=UPI003F2E2E93